MATMRVRIPANPFRFSRFRGAVQHRFFQFASLRTEPMVTSLRTRIFSCEVVLVESGSDGVCHVCREIQGGPLSPYMSPMLPRYSDWGATGKPLEGALLSKLAGKRGGENND